LIRVGFQGHFSGLDCPDEERRKRSLLESVMVTAERARELLSMRGIVKPQLPDDWTGKFPLPTSVERFFQEVGPADITIEGYGNPFFLPRLATLWEFQAGYRWNGVTGQPIEDWDDDWLVVADESGDPFILSRATGNVLYTVHGSGVWAPAVMFVDLNTMRHVSDTLGPLSFLQARLLPTKTVSFGPSITSRR
jgi:hypothetical protein